MQGTTITTITAAALLLLLLLSSVPVDVDAAPVKDVWLNQLTQFLANGTQNALGQCFMATFPEQNKYVPRAKAKEQLGLLGKRLANNQQLQHSVFTLGDVNHEWSYVGLVSVGDLKAAQEVHNGVDTLVGMLFWQNNRFQDGKGIAGWNKKLAETNKWLKANCDRLTMENAKEERGRMQRIGAGLRKAVGSPFGRGTTNANDPEKKLESFFDSLIDKDKPSLKKEEQKFNQLLRACVCKQMLGGN